MFQHSLFASVCTVELSLSLLLFLAGGRGCVKGGLSELNQLSRVFSCLKIIFLEMLECSC